MRLYVCLWALFYHNSFSLGSNTLPGESQAESHNVDVAIIGGGAAGTYAAVRLSEDFNISIVVIEPKDHLGGSVSTYLVPETNTTVEFGVQTYLPYNPANDFFTRFNIITQPFSARRLSSWTIDIETGAQLKDYVAPSLNATNAALERWYALIEKYESYLEPGYWGFPFPGQIPDDFLIAFVDFVKLHDLEAAVPRIVTISGVGTGGLSKLITLDVMQAFGPSITRSAIDNTFIIPKDSNSLLYERALATLGERVLLSSTVQSVSRNWTSSQLTVLQGTKQITINTKRILFTAPLSISALSPYQLDAKEKSIFSELPQAGQIIALAKIPCLPENFTINFVPKSVVPSHHLNLRSHPYNIRFDSTGPPGLSLFRIIQGTNTSLSVTDFKSQVKSSLAQLQAVGTIPATSDCSVDFRSISDHSRPQWAPSADAVKNGFVSDLMSLQNYRGIWWSGYAWSVPFSSTIWAFTESVVEMILKDLRHNPV